MANDGQAVGHSLPAPIRARDLLWLALGLLMIVGTGIGVRDPWPADEPRFAVIARDMVLTGEWLFPRVGGDLYQDKPPLFFWMLVASYSLFGSVKASFLVPAFLAAGCVLLLIYDLGRRLVSRQAGLAAALLVLCTLQFMVAMRGAQIDPVLCALTTIAVYGLCRHLLLGPTWRWYAIAGIACGLGVITKGVGFLPLLMLAPFFLLRHFRWQGLAAIDAGRGGWRWWLAPLAMLGTICLWFVPMMIGVAQGDTEYLAYRDEILLKQTVGRYATAWHHVKGWHYFLTEVIPALWLPWSVLLFWLVPRFKAAWRAREARVWLPVGWVLVVLLFFSASPGKRGIYILPALPALAIACLPFIDEVLAKRGVRIAGFVLGGLFCAMALVGIAVLDSAVLPRFDAVVAFAGNIKLGLITFFVLCGAGLIFAARHAPLLAWPMTLGSLAIVFSYIFAPAMNGERSGSSFTHSTLAQLQAGEQLALVAYKEQFLLYLDRPVVNFGHRRWREGNQEAYDAAAWLNGAPGRVLLVPGDAREPCFRTNASLAGRSAGEDWFLVRAPAATVCASLGDAKHAIRYSPVAAIVSDQRSAQRHEP